MAKPVFSLKHVSDEEADAVRALLSDHDITFYETPDNIWRASTPAIWLHNDSDYQAARELINYYQTQRTESRRNAESASSQPFITSLLTDFTRHPFRFIGFFVLIFIVTGLSIRPFFQLH